MNHQVGALLNRVDSKPTKFESRSDSMFSNPERMHVYPLTTSRQPLKHQHAVAINSSLGIAMSCGW